VALQILEIDEFEGGYVGGFEHNFWSEASFKGLFPPENT